MKSRFITGAFIVLSALVVGACFVLDAKISKLNNKIDDENSKRLSVDFVQEAALTEKFMCARADWCEVDFTRLAAHPEVLIGKRVFILGYLGIDHGVVSLFATQDDFLRMQSGRSLEIAGSRRDLSALVETHGNQYVRIEGTYQFPPLGRGRSGRLGTLVPPLIAREFHARSSEQAMDDISVRVQYPNEN
jgi:hypothetical protein